MGKEDCDNSNSINIEALIREQRQLLESVQKQLTNHKKDTASRRTASNFKRRLEALERCSETFWANHRLIMAEVEDSDLYVQTSLNDQFEEAYIESTSTIEEAFRSAFPNQFEITFAPKQQAASSSPIAHRKSVSSTPVASSHFVRLPKLNLPVFNGECLQWPSFFDAFQTIDMDPNLSNAQKMQYLKGVLSGPAERLIRHLSITDENYSLALDELDKAYNNKRMIFMEQLTAFFNQPPIVSEQTKEVQELLSVSRATMHGLEKLGATLEAVFLHIVLQRLPAETRTFCLQSFDANRIPTWEDLERSIQIRINSLPFQEPKRNTKDSSNKNIEPREAKYNKNRINQGAYHVAQQVECPNCGESHFLYSCPRFIQSTIQERRAAVEKNNLCFNCLRANHRADRCISKSNCRACGARHHSLIHLPKPTNAPAANIIAHVRHQEIPSTFSHHTKNRGSSQQTLLATAIIKIRDRHGRFTNIRALLDQGSQATLITEAAVQRLGLSKTPVRAQINGVGAGAAKQSQYVTPIVFSSCYDTTFQTSTEAFVLNRLTSYLPTYRVNHTKWDRIQHLKLADPQFMNPNHVDILLGADVYAELLRPGLIQGETGTPIAQNTILGWILSGKIIQGHNSSINISNFHTHIEIDNILRKFWELEEVPSERYCSQEDQWCEEFFQRTHRRQESGKYMVRLPLKSHYDSEAVLGSSKLQAIKRFQHLERRFSQDPELRKTYTAVINEYEELEQMELEYTEENEHINTETHGYESCYLPHHAVIKESSSTTKLRVVFDASARTSNKKSLNDILVTGAALQTELVQVILNWRLHKYVFTTDIEKMYRRIGVEPRDTHYQRILWRNNPQEKLKTYRLKTVTFGTASAPFTAIRVMHQLAKDEAEKFPLAAYTLRNEMYVDDILSGHDNIESALMLQQQLIGCLQQGSFELRKWSSNSAELLEPIPEEHREGTVDFHIRSDASIKALGIYWNPKTDSLNYRINFSLQNDKFTKRMVLSTIARLFDPLGWVNPIIVSAKIFLKQLWCDGLDWDDPLSTKLSTIWQTYLVNLQEITKINIPRWIYTYKTYQAYELHTFCDGSMQAYSAVTYLRITTQQDEIFVNLVMAKCKVSPKKQLTIPRIELCAAVLASKLHKFVKSVMQNRCEHMSSYFWTDSNIVLAWIRGNPDRWKTFVCNRIHTILENTNIDNWRHIVSAENPADVSSRGITAQQLNEHDLWWHGPPWLRKPESNWPSSSQLMPDIDEISISETKKKYFVAVSTVDTTNNIIYKYSSYLKLIKVTAWCLRFIHNARLIDKTARNCNNYLTREDWSKATSHIYRRIQQEMFSSELVALKHKRSLPQKSKLIGLNPFLDTEGILRVGGRLKHSLLDFAEKHPIIVPTFHHVTSLLIDHWHSTCLHGGVQLTLNQIRKRCWIIQGRRSVAYQLKKCQVCFKNKPSPNFQLMGDLPHVRVRPSRPFAATGVDYAGPINLRVSKGRGHKSYKGYVAVFVCLSTKAIHLEVVSDLTTSAFLAALQRFFARRGLARDMYSDCGSTFIGANNQLQQNVKLTKQLFEKEIIPHLTKNEINWHFIPPFSPHFGGLWEAGVKSMKHHLKRIVPNFTLTFEELTTVLSRIEACLNSRPLCPLGNSPDEFAVLTPGHFLIGDALLSPPEMPVEDLSLTNRWHQMQKIVHDFWKIWSKEYLSRLQLRPKWKREKENVKLGDLVLIKQDNLPPNSWKLGRVIEVFTGNDQLVRVVTLKTQDGIIKRPVVKICLLPCSQPESNP